MFPKTVTTTVAMPPEKPCVNGAKDSAVLYIQGGEQQVVVDDSRWRVKRAAICACAVILTTLILVAGALGGLAIVLKHTNIAVHKAEPTRSSLVGKTAEPKLPDSKPRIKIDDGGLWPPEPLATELVAIDGGIDEGIKIDDGEDTPERVPSGNEVQIDEEDDLLTKPPPEEPSYSYGVMRSWLGSSSSSQIDSSSDDYENGRTYISSSFPYDGYYMRGGVGDPPYHKESYEGKLPSSWEEDSGVEDLSGDEDEDFASGEQTSESSYSGASSEMFSEDSSSVSYSDPYIVSD